MDLRQIPAYYLNRKDDSVRLNHMEQVCKRFGFIEYHRVEGPIGPERFKCGSLGMCRIVELALQREPFKPFIILEDDVNSSPYYNWDDDLSYKIDIPKNADSIHLGISSCGLDSSRNINVDFVKLSKHNDQLVQIYNMLSLHAVLVITKKYARNFMRNLIEAAVNNTTWDTITARSMCLFNCYALIKPVFYQDKTVGGQEIPTLITFENYKYTLSLNEAQQIKDNPLLISTHFPISSTLLLSHPNKLHVKTFAPELIHDVTKLSDYNIYLTSCEERYAEVCKKISTMLNVGHITTNNINSELDNYKRIVFPGTFLQLNEFVNIQKSTQDIIIVLSDITISTFTN